MANQDTQLKVSGTIIKTFKAETGEGKNGAWIKQSFLIKTNDKYPKEIYFTAWGDVVEDVPSKGDVTVYFNLESKSWNDKYITNANAWKIER